MVEAVETMLASATLDDDGASGVSLLHTAPTSPGGTLLSKPSLEDFTLLKVIGKGCFGKIILCRQKQSQKLFAMKVLSKPNIVKRKQVEHTKTERRVLGTIQHPYIVTMFNVFFTDFEMQLAMQICNGGG